ncbi:UNVERIFIED_CONTAM: hypothetical protein K2H54_056324 [Gekko kuhli]
MKTENVRNVRLQGYVATVYAAAVAVFNRSMLKVTMPSSSSSSSSAASGRAPGPGPAAAAAAPDYWIDGSNRDTLADYYELESELGR